MKRGLKATEISVSVAIGPVSMKRGLKEVNVREGVIARAHPVSMKRGLKDQSHDHGLPFSSLGLDEKRIERALTGLATSMYYEGSLDEKRIESPRGLFRLPLGWTQSR